ncbi:MAG: hypothetical protein ACKOFW_01620 [Planctomycetaceae bacterium]
MLFILPPRSASDIGQRLVSYSAISPAPTAAPTGLLVARLPQRRSAGLRPRGGLGAG